MIDLRRVGSALTLYVTSKQLAKPQAFVGAALGFGALYYFGAERMEDPTWRMLLTALCVAGPIVVGLVLYLLPTATSTISSFDPATRRIRLVRKRERGEDVVLEAGFDEVTALRVTEDNPERPRFDVLSLRLSDGRKVTVAVKSREYAAGNDNPNQDLRKIAAYIRNETGLPSDD